MASDEKKSHGGHREGAGRPPLLSGGRRVQVVLDAASLETAVDIGAGNRSEGIRIALAYYKANPPTR